MHEIHNTWLFMNVSSGYEGKVTIHKKVPDTITSWIITGFAIDPVTGFGMTQTPRKLEVFQPFFVSTDLPYSIKRGESVSIPIVVFNYMNDDVEAEVTLDNTLLEFDFVDISNEIDPKPKVELYRTKKVQVKSNNGASVSFMIRPKRPGYITIKVTAKSDVAGDGVERQLLVEPEGVTQFMNKAFFVDLRDANEFSTEIEVKVPRNAIPDSTKVQFSAIGDILGPTVRNLDKLIKLPYGCGEQNMLNFVPNIEILKYLTKTNKLTPAVKDKSLKYMEQGYQRELKYKHPDGSYSAFGPGSDKRGSTWLTAFVLKSFIQAKQFIDIDQKIIDSAFKFLVDNQAADGSFPEIGVVSHKAMQGGAGSALSLSAYVLTSFLQTKEDIITHRNTISKALDYILKNSESVEDIYTLSVVTYALQLADHSNKLSSLQTLQSKAKEGNGQVWWEKPVEENQKRNPYYQDSPSSINVEITAYAMMAYLQAGKVAEAVPIMKWLIAQRNEEGGFASTQDTVVGIGALAEIGERITVPENNVQLVAKYNDEETTININNDNAAILQQKDLPPATRKVTIKGTGHGVGMGQISFKYNVNVTGAFPRFNLDPQVNKNSNQDYLHLTICTSYIPNPEANDLKSNMAVMEVKFPSGFTADADTLPSLEKSAGVQKVETKDGDTVVVMYFDNLDHNELCPTVTGFRTHKIANQKPAPVTVYDYYDNALRARAFYKGQESSLCDICEGADCGDKCTPQAQEQKSTQDSNQHSATGGTQINSLAQILSISMFMSFLLRHFF